ncbi:thioredoxin-dependent thiol peroxidase [Treponema sp.]
MLKEGDFLPKFSLPDQNGKIVDSESFVGKPLIVYFYPKDDTPGCTKEACSFRDAYADFKAKGAQVVGISADGSTAHAKFASKYELPFILLSDEEKNTIKAFGAWGEKSMYGKTYEGILRSTFVFGADGRVLRVFPKVKPENHALEILPLL